MSSPYGMKETLWQLTILLTSVDVMCVNHKEYKFTYIKEMGCTPNLASKDAVFWN